MLGIRYSPLLAPPLHHLPPFPLSFPKPPHRLGQLEAQAVWDTRVAACSPPTCFGVWVSFYKPEGAMILGTRDTNMGWFGPCPTAPPPPTAGGWPSGPGLSLQPALPTALIYISSPCPRGCEAVATLRLTGVGGTGGLGAPVRLLPALASAPFWLWGS